MVHPGTRPTAGSTAAEGGRGQPASRSSGVSGSASEATGTWRRMRISSWIGPVTSQTFTFMPAVTRPSDIQKAMNSRSSTLPRQTTVSPGPASPEYSMPRSYWSVKKYGTRS